MAFKLKRNDTSPAIRSTLLDGSGTVILLTGASVKFLMKDKAGNIIVNAAAVIIDAINGVVEYQWIGADTAVLGFYKAEFEVTYSDGTVETFPNEGFTSILITEDIG